MKPIRFEIPSIKTIYVVNMDQVLWVEFVSVSEMKQITFRFAKEKLLSVTDSQVGEEKFKRLMIETNIEEIMPRVRAI